MTARHAIEIDVNGKQYEGLVEPRLSLADFLRDHLGLTGTHLGCEQGICGSCTILFDGETVRSCLLLAVQANGGVILTVEGLASKAKDGNLLHPLQQGFLEKLGFQCGFCTPGFLMTLYEFLNENPSPSEDEIRERLSGNLCRCTGYQNIVAAALWAAERLRTSSDWSWQPFCASRISPSFGTPSRPKNRLCRSAASVRTWSKASSWFSLARRAVANPPCSRSLRDWRNPRAARSTSADP